MPVWIWWAVGGVVTYWLNINSQKQAALQSVDVGLLMVRSATSQAAANATNTITIQSAVGPLKAESTISDGAKASAQALSTTVLAPDWLVLATSVKSAGFPVLANSIASLGMTLLENGKLNIN
jgi:hypothetical protein